MAKARPCQDQFPSLSQEMHQVSGSQFFLSDPGLKLFSPWFQSPACKAGAGPGSLTALSLVKGTFIFSRNAQIQEGGWWHRQESSTESDRMVRTGEDGNNHQAAMLVTVVLF